MSKACQYGSDDAKICHGFVKANLKNAQKHSLQKSITWTKKSKKGRQECKNIHILL
jgi:hypothetical protein